MLQRTGGATTGMRGHYPGSTAERRKSSSRAMRGRTWLRYELRSALRRQQVQRLANQCGNVGSIGSGGDRALGRALRVRAAVAEADQRFDNILERGVLLR